MNFRDLVVARLGDDDDKPPVGSLPDQLRKYQGPWFQTQLAISLVLGGLSFLIFCFARRRNKVLFAPRTLLKGFSPHEVHASESWLGWILPTLRTSEYAVLQLVGLDAAVVGFLAIAPKSAHVDLKLLSFFKLGYQFFTICSILACAILIPINLRENGTADGATPIDDPKDEFTKKPNRVHGTDLLMTTHFIFTCLFSLIALYMLHRTYNKFVQSRQLFSLEHAHSIPARTVLITRIPPHLRSEKQLAEYFESMGEALHVESVNVARKVQSLSELLVHRTACLLRLESAWTAYVGNPAVKAPGYDPQLEVRRITQEPLPSGTASEASPNLIDHESNNANGEAENADEEAQLAMPKLPALYTIPGKKRPTIRPHWFGKKVDALEYYAEQFRQADRAVLNRRNRRFRAAESAFVTFETLAGAQIAAQVCHYPQPSAMHTTLAPEPRDIHWGNLMLTSHSIALRFFLVAVATVLLLLFWGTPVFFLASLLSYDTIKRYSPWLARQIERFPAIGALVQNSLPSLAFIGFNAILPYILEYLCYFQGLQAKSWIEYSLMKKYYLFLLITVFFIFVSVSTVQLARDLSEQPLKLIEKLATTLPAARNFYVSYIMLQGIGIMPLQLLQLATIIPNLIFRVFITRTPRDHAELNAPPTINLGVVYPQAILIFVIGLTYSVIMPVILIFAAIYFGIAYLVYKYKLLNVYHRPFESRGQAWPITFNRIAFGLLIFQLFMTGIFITHEAVALIVYMVPVLFGTLFACIRMNQTFSKLSHYVNLSRATEIQREGATPDVRWLKRGHPITPSQTNLNRSRYKHLEDHLYVVAESDKTDYSQPPLSDVFYGVLNLGRRRYGIPALNGQLPGPWLPAKKEVDPEPQLKLGTGEGIVIDLRRRWSMLKGTKYSGQYSRERSPFDDATRAWREDINEVIAREAGSSAAKDDFGVQALYADQEVPDEDVEVGRYKTYFRRPEARRRQFPGHWAGSDAQTSEDDAGDEEGAVE